MSDPEGLDQFIAILDALYARREVLAGRMDYLTLATSAAERSAEEQEEIEIVQQEYRQIEERIANVKDRLKRTGRAE